MTTEPQRTGRSSPRWVLQTPSTSTSLSASSGAKRRYTPEQFQLAIKAVCEDGLSTTQASALHGVPKSTIWHHLYAGRTSSSPSSSSSPSATARKSPYPLRHLSAPGDSSRSLNKSPYHFRQQPSSRQSPQTPSTEKHPLAKHGKSATSSQVIHQRSSRDTSRRKSGSRSGIAVGGGNACCFCGSAEDNTVTLGKMCVLREFRVHYFCLLFSSGLPQNGEDDEGILGFLEEDIKAEILRGRKLSCSYCLKKGATIGCVEKKCKRKYHFPCGIRNSALCMFSNDYRSYCSLHREYQSGVGVGQTHECPICMEQLVADPKQAVWAPCCQRSSWFHKQCLQMLALNAGYFYKCPLCNDTQTFLPEMRKQGIYVPEQDASWELEPNAFSELLERPISCEATQCHCPDGRKADVDGTWWEVLLCSMCGSTGVHVRCGGLPFTATCWTCHDCTSTGATRASASNVTATPARYPTRRTREARDEGGGGGDVSRKKRRLEQAPGPDISRVEENEEEVDTTVPPDTVLLQLEELGEEVPAALQRLKERVRLVQARMKELRLTEGEVVRAAQRMSASLSGGSGQEPQSSIGSALPCPMETQSKSVTQTPKLTLSRNCTLPDKTQLTLVAMTQHPVPAPSAIAHPDKEQNGSPRHQTFSLDKAHLLAFWRCALPLVRMKEVLNILEAIFTQREAQAAKAAQALAARHRPSPRTTSNSRRTPARHCTTPTTQWQGWAANHGPVTPHSTASSPTTPQSSLGHTSTPHSTLHHPSTPNGVSHHSTPQSSTSWQPLVLCSESPQHRTSQTDPQYPRTPISGSPYPSTHSDSWHHSSPYSSSCQSKTLCSESCQHDAQGLNMSQRQSPSIINTESESSQSQQPATARSSKAHSNRQPQPLASAKSVVEEPSPPTTRSASHAAATEELGAARSACRRLLLQPNTGDDTTSITNTGNSKASSEDAQDSTSSTRQAMLDATSDRMPASQSATTKEDSTTTTTKNDSNNNNNNNNKNKTTTTNNKSNSSNNNKAITRNDTIITTTTTNTNTNTSANTSTTTTTTITSNSNNNNDITLTTTTNTTTNINTDTPTTTTNTTTRNDTVTTTTTDTNTSTTTDTNTTTTTAATTVTTKNDTTTTTTNNNNISNNKSDAVLPTSQKDAKPLVGTVCSPPSFKRGPSLPLLPLPPLFFGHHPRPSHRLPPSHSCRSLPLLPLPPPSFGHHPCPSHPLPPSHSCPSPSPSPFLGHHPHLRSRLLLHSRPPHSRLPPPFSHHPLPSSLLLHSHPRPTPSPPHSICRPPLLHSTPCAPRQHLHILPLLPSPLPHLYHFPQLNPPSRLSHPSVCLVANPPFLPFSSPSPSFSSSILTIRNLS